MEIVFLGREHNVTHREIALSYNFRILDNWDKSDAEIIFELVKNKKFLQGIEDGRISSLFNYELVRSEDFATFNKQNLYKYLDDYFNNAEWTEHHIEDIKPNIAWLKKDIEKYSPGNFFVLNMTLFEETSKIVRQSKRSMYSYYFVAIFWCDRENCIVTYSELFWEILSAEIIKQYVDLAIKERKECLEYQRVRDEWKLTRTRKAQEIVVEKKYKYKKAAFDRNKVRFVLMANRINPGDSKFSSEMKRLSDYECNVFVPQQTRYLENKYIPKIREIFKEYVQCRTYISTKEYNEPLEKKEIMQDSLGHLPAVLHKNYIPLLIEIWMYYDMPYFTAREVILNGVFIKNKVASLPAIRRRINNRKKWESQDKSPYSDLIELEKKLNND